MSLSWTDAVDEVLDGDHVVMLCYATPAKGVVLLPVTNFAVRDRAAGTITAVSTSVGAWKKLERIRKDPHVALAYHTRAHARTGRSEYVLVQGKATLWAPIPDYPSTILENWERYEPWGSQGRLLRWWRRAYGLRVAIEVQVERVTVWPDLRAWGPPQVAGAPPAGPPAPQDPPKKGTGPRLDAIKAARKANSLPDCLVGWVGADGFPVAVPAVIGAARDEGIVLDLPLGVLPPGGRRAGLTAHWFALGVTGQDQRKYTGWLEATGDGRALYSPHTEASYRFPDSRLLFDLVSGAATRRGLRGAREAGWVD